MAELQSPAPGAAASTPRTAAYARLEDGAASTPPRLSSASIVPNDERREGAFKLVKINAERLVRSHVFAAAAEEEGDERVFPSNEVRTAKYTWWNFVPVFLFQSFQKTANLYFLLVSVFQTIPSISPTDGVPVQGMTLAVVILADGIFVALEDRKRHRADHRANAASTRVFNRATRAFERVEWRNVKVGDFVQVRNHETVPADLLLLAVEPADGAPHDSSSGICYVETMSLDGETNLKLREAPEPTRAMFATPTDAGDALTGFLESEMPNGDVNQYSATLYTEPRTQDAQHAPVATPVTLKNMLLRGSKLRNTKAAYGLVVNTGVDAKIMRNLAREFPYKISNIDLMTNNQTMAVVLLLSAVCLFGAIADCSSLADLSFLPTIVPRDVISKSVIVTFAYYMTMLCDMVPIALYVSTTIVRTTQSYFMEKDLDMYDTESESRMLVRSMQLNDQLGQISHVFSDKTGTLTCNKMEFRKCSVNGKSYGKGTTAIGLAALQRHDVEGRVSQLARVEEAEARDVDEQDSDGAVHAREANVNFRDPELWKDLRRGDDHALKLRAFFTHLALCHGVLIEHLDVEPSASEKDASASATAYSASSPDEQALVSGAKYFGFEFLHRTSNTVSVKTPEGAVETFDILEVFEFDSKRKRMSVVVKKQGVVSDEVLLLCKGADSVIFSRLAHSSTSNERTVQRTQEHLDAFARDGLRTLVIGSKTVPQQAWEEFHARYRTAAVNLREVEAKAQGEKNRIDDLQDEMEQELELLGTTAIEDRLQDGVPETMECLRDAGISVWMLTGDMEETAINIGYACRLLNNDIRRHIVNGASFSTQGAILQELDRIFHLIHDGKEGNETETTAANGGEHALVVDGASMNHILEDPVSGLHLLRVTLLCKVVIACRVAPHQKAKLVELVKRNVPDAQTLSIGDGANDVPMIQAAHVGVGISGQEGMQAVNSADYALGQFRFLRTLLLAHGRWNYNRVAGLTLYTFYKNIMYCMVLFWYCLPATSYSGQMMYSPLIQQFFNLLFTAIPIVIFGVMDRDIPKAVAIEYPGLYHRAARGRTLFTYSRFWIWFFTSIADSVGVYLVTIAAAYNVMRSGSSVELTVLWSVGWSIMVVFVNARFAFMVNSWDIFEVCGIVFSIGSLYGLQTLFDSIEGATNTYSFPWLFSSWQFWLGHALVIVAIMMKDVFYGAYCRRFVPEYVDLVNEHLSATKKGHGNEDPEAGVDLKSVDAPAVSFMRPELVELLDYSEWLRHEATQRHVSPGDVLATGKGLRRDQKLNFDIRQRILQSNDPVIFENERYVPFRGYGSTYPGHLLPTDCSRWSDRSATLSAMSIHPAGLEVDLTVPGCDEHGWVYASSFHAEPTLVSPTHDQRRDGSFRGLVRRRQWVVSSQYLAHLGEYRKAMHPER